MAKTELVFIVDRSGSMESIASNMEGAIEEVINEQRDREEVYMTYVRFDNEYEEVFINTPINQIKGIEISPRGSTSLLDAIGKTISNFKSRFENTDEEDRPEKVLFIIITDGEENTSVEFNRNTIFSMIESAKSDYEWEFTFIGANQDAIQEGGRLGIASMDSLDYDATPIGVDTMTRSFSCYVSNFMDTGKASYDDLKE